MGFITYIKGQKDRDDDCGRLANDYIRIIKSPNVYKNVAPIDSDTLLGFYNHIPYQYRSDNENIEALIILWQEYLEYKQIGLKFNEPEIGFVYFLKVKGHNAYKIGKTKKDPLVRLAQIASNEKVELDIFNWLKIKHYSLIEFELKQTFRKYQIQREWYKFKYVGISINGEEFCSELSEAIHIYSHTDYECVLFKDNFY